MMSFRRWTAFSRVLYARAWKRQVPVPRHRYELQGAAEVLLAGESGGAVKSVILFFT